MNESAFWFISSLSSLSEENAFFSHSRSKRSKSALRSCVLQLLLRFFILSFFSQWIIQSEHFQIIDSLSTTHAGLLLQYDYANSNFHLNSRKFIFRIYLNQEHCLFYLLLFSFCNYYFYEGTSISPGLLNALTKKIINAPANKGIK